MVGLFELERYLNDYLEVNKFDDYAPNGLQVEGRHEIKKIITGVTACRALIEEAIDEGADLLLVHHGYFWRGEDARIIGMKAQRLKLLLNNQLSMMAYHLPLDAHVTVGNNAQLAARLGLTVDGAFGEGRVPLAIYGHLPEPMSLAAFAGHVASCVGREPLVIEGGRKTITSVGLCTGAAQSYLNAAANLRLDVFISGEISENTVHLAREREINFISAGHHATEKFGVCALGEHLAEKFDLEHVFVDINNPV
jgi:dinuclear metal center YbgI/SA1388 family protein